MNKKETELFKDERFYALMSFFAVGIFVMIGIGSFIVLGKLDFDNPATKKIDMFILTFIGILFISFFVATLFHFINGYTTIKRIKKINSDLSTRLENIERNILINQNESTKKGAGLENRNNLTENQ